MSPENADLATAGYMVFIWWAMWKFDRLASWPAVLFAINALIFSAFAVVNLRTGGPANGAMDAAIAGWSAYRAWKRRKPRQRKPSKAVGWVRDLGHRLVVTHS